MKKLFLISAIIVVILIIGGIYFMSGDSKNVTGNVVNNGNENTKIINLKAERWQFTPEIITLKQGEHVKIIINNTDTTHGIVIPALGVSGIDSVEFTADKPGTYEFKCPTMCGEGHRDMKGTLIVQ